MKLLKKVAVLAMAGMLAVTSANAFSKRNAEKQILLTGSDGQQYPIVFATGVQGGTWGNGADNLKTKAGINRDTGIYNMKVEYVNGAEDIKYHLQAKEANAGFMPGDWIPSLLADADFKAGKTFIKLAPETAEKVQLIMRKGMDEDDLQSKIKGHTPVVFAGPVGSGSVHTGYTIKELEPNYIFDILEGEKADDYDYDITAITALLSGEIDAIIRMSNPIPGKDTFGKLVTSTKGIELVDFDDKDINDSMKLPNGKEEAVYEFVDFNYKGGFFSSDTEAPAAATYLVIDKKNMTKKSYKALLNAVNKVKYNPFK